MGQTISTEQVSAHLERQDALVKQLRAVVDRQAQALVRGGAAVAVDYDQDGQGEPLEPPTYLNDELVDVDQFARAAERRKREEPVDEEERAAGNVEWCEPTEEEERSFMATKPWLGAMAPPTGFEFGKTDGIPDAELQLEHVYGFRTGGVRRNVVWVDASTILYFAAAVGVVHDVGANTQRHFRGHVDDILCIAYHPQRRVVATGDQGRFPSVCIWNVDSCEQVAKCAGFHRRAVAALAFSADGSRLATVGLDNDHSIAVYDWSRGDLLASTKGDTNRILDVRFNTSAGADPNAEFVTVGVRHIRFWTHSATTVRARKGLLGSLGRHQTLLSVTTSGSYTIAGTQGGELYFFDGQRLVQVIDAHQKGVFSLVCAGDSTLYSGGFDGCVLKWNLNTMRREGLVDLNKTSAAAPPAQALRARTNSVRALDFLPESGLLLAGTITGCIARVNPCTGEADVLVTSHFGDLSAPNHYGELWGLYPSPRDERLLSAGEDGTLRVWDACARRQMAQVALRGRAQCVAWSPDGAFVAVGLQDGTLTVFNDAFEEIRSMRRGPRRVQCARFSPDGSILATGTADNVVNLFEVDGGNFRFVGRLTGNTSVVLHVDFSADGKYLQTCSQSYELLFYDVASQRQVTASRSLRDVQWATFSSILGWDVQGIWPRASNGTDVNSLKRSNSGRYLATGGDCGNVKLFNYPCVGSGLDRRGSLLRRPEFRTATGHSEHVTEVQWSADDARLYTAGGGDLSIFQWRVVAAA